MSIAEVERWLAPVWNYDPASVDEAARGVVVRPSSSRPCGHAGFSSDLWRVKKAAPEKLSKKNACRAA
jgi:hypothetical protein